MVTATSSDPRRDKDTNVLNRSGLNPRRACIKRALTSSACVCKPAAAKFTSNYERSPAWHSATDWKLNSTFVTDIHRSVRAPETRGNGATVGSTALRAAERCAASVARVVATTNACAAAKKVR